MVMAGQRQLDKVNPAPCRTGQTEDERFPNQKRGAQNVQTGTHPKLDRRRARPEADQAAVCVWLGTRDDYAARQTPPHLSNPIRIFTRRLLTDPDRGGTQII
jgi:hypothetical protein